MASLMATCTSRPSMVADRPSCPALRRSNPLTSRVNRVATVGRGRGGREGAGRGRRGVQLRVHAKMDVPTDAFGGMSPENKAGAALNNLFTMTALRIVLAQEQGFGNECHDDPTQTELYSALVDYYNDAPMRDGTEWLEGLMAHPDTQMKLAGIRILEVRDKFATEEFDWDSMKEASIFGLKNDNQKLMGRYMENSMRAGEGGGGAGGADGMGR